MSISLEEQRIILKRYLDFFYVPITKQDIILFKKQYPVLQNYYIQHTPENLKKIGCYLLLLRGNEKYKLYNTYELFQNYIGANEDSKEWLDLTTPVIFLYYAAFTEQNKKIMEILCHLIAHRRTKNLISVVLTETPLPTLRDVILNTKQIEIKPQNVYTNITQVNLESKPVIKKQKRIDPFI